MALIERLVRQQGLEQGREQRAEDAEPGDGPGIEVQQDAAVYQELKSRVHNLLFEHLDLTRMGQVSREQMERDVAATARRILDDEKHPMTADERDRVVREVQDEVFGLGPLEPLLADPTISDILVNRHDLIFVERFGRLDETVARFKDDAHLMRIIEKIVSQVGRRIDETQPMVDARLADGSRVNAIVPPLAIDGPCLSIRRFAAEALTDQDLVANETLTPEIVDLLRGAVQARLNVLISGGTGAGKTTLLNVLSRFIPDTERIVTIEDSAELQLQQRHVVRLETRPANIEGRGRVAQRDLVINSLRMRPDRIIVGEVRGAEALDMLQAMNTGHEGSLTTIHANSPRDALSRVETMVAMTGLDLPERAVREQIASALDIVIQLSRLSDGRRTLVSFQEITGMEGPVVTTQEIFRFEREGVGEDGRVLGQLHATGVRPRFLDAFAAAGVQVPTGLFRRAA